MERAKRWTVLGVFVCWLIFNFFGISFIRSAAATYDEPLHLASGYSYLMGGRYRLNISDHPPLAEMWAAVPLLALRPVLNRSHPDWLSLRRYYFADDFLYRNGIPPGIMLNSGRAFSVLTVSALLFSVVGLWGWSLAGPLGATLSAAAAAFSPVLVSNLSVVSTDGLSAVLFFCCFYFLSRRPLSRRDWLLAGLCAGLSLAAKFNMVLLPVFAGGMLLLERLKNPREAPKLFPDIILAAAAAFFALALAYRFSQLDLFWSGFKSTFTRLDQGRSSFLMGSYSLTGFPLYFPIALLLKTPIALLLLSVGMALAWGRSPKREQLWVLLPPIAYFAVAMTAKVQIGIRHLLPIIPFLALLAGCAAAALWERGKKGRIAAAALACWAAASVGAAHPHHLAFFNEIAGGKNGGYRWLVDSNLDWGQDLESLGVVLGELGSPPIYLAYFGVADPAAYGIRFVPVAYNWNVPRSGDPVDPAALGRVLFAVSATTLQAVYIEDRSAFDWLKRRVPLRVLGGSIFLYDLTEDAEGRRELASLLVRSEYKNAAGLSKSLLLQ